MTTEDRDPTPSAPRGWGARVSRLARPRQLSPAGKVAYWGTAVAVLVAAAFIVTAAAAPPRKAALPPRPAKGFSLAELGHAGATLSLASYAGRPVVLNFFASWCAPCRRETPLLAQFYASEHGRVVVLGIDGNDEKASALRFIAKAGVGYPVGFDPFPASVTTSYGVYALPQTFFLNAQHRVVARVQGAVTQQVLARDVALMDQDRG